MNPEPSRELTARPAEKVPEAAAVRTEPPVAKRGFLRTLLALGAVVVAVVYILNPTAGVFELLPDNLPGIGNLDEAGAVALLLLGLRRLGRRS